MIRTESKAKPAAKTVALRQMIEQANDRQVAHYAANAVPMPEMVTGGLAKAGRGRPASGKVVVSIRLDPAVIAKFKATGDGWQALINDVLVAAKL